MIKKKIIILTTLSALLIIPAASARIFSYQVGKQAAMGLLYFNENNTTKTHDI